MGKVGTFRAYPFNIKGLGNRKILAKRNCPAASKEEGGGG
jgi:hypothetical protein